MTATTTRDGWLEDRQFGIVLDAGSSGTRIQVYSWKSPEAQQKERLANNQSIRVLPRIETGVQDGSEWQLKAEPGISSFGSHPHHLGQYLKPLLDHALKLIPPAQIPTTPFYLLATAGMRLLPQSQQDDILQEVCRYIKGNYRFRIHHCHQHVQIISGEEEGTFGWLAVNYLMDGFDPPHHASSASASQQPSSTFGFLDMGGASTQIAFEPNPLAQIEHADNLTKLTLRLLDGTDISHSVFVTTWLGYGTNKARERYAQQLVQQHSSDHQTSARIQQQSQSAVIPDPCLPTSLVLPSPSPNYQFNGTGDFKQCIQNVSPLLNKNAPCLDEPCLFDGKHVPPIDFSVNRFIGISEYWYSTQDLWSMGGIYDFVEFEKKAISYCQLNWGEIIENHKSGTTWPSNVEISRLETQCFKAAWIINILHEGIGIPRIIDKGGRGDRKDYNQQGVQKAAQKGLLNSPSPAGFQSLNEVGNITVSWTLGKMVLELSQQLSSGRHPSSEEHSFGRPQHEKDMKEPLSHVRSWINPMVFIVVILGALLCWFLYSYSRTLCQFQKERRLGGQGYVLASMEEGDGGRRESHYSRGQNTGRFFRKPSLSSSRGLTPYAEGAGLIQQTVSRAMRAWTHSPFTTSSHPNAASRAARGSPNFAKLQAAGTSEDDGRHEPPVSITTSLSAPVGGAGFQASVSARTSLEDGLFMSVPISRAASSTARLFDDRPATLPPHSSPHLDSPGQTDLLFPTPDRPKYRFSHSKSFQSLSSPQHHHHLDELDYQPSAIHDRAHSSSPSHHHSFHPHFQHQHHHQQQQNILNSHSCSNLTDFNLHSQ